MSVVNGSTVRARRHATLPRSAPVLATHRQTLDTGEWISDWAELRSVQLRARDRHSSAVIVERPVRLRLAPNLEGIKLGELRPSHVTSLAERLQGTGRVHRSERRSAEVEPGP